ncbi:dTDP-4-dehydrorhamnose 3,5-epimerase [Stutzerimonas nitrititolerans]|uniref:dTDP-4-dehydrorhamnose 3,5-epimerase n=1 Tax=Stutzerimonas nitrititolerans TaxID=2482751 RepID=UPI00289ACB1A|nr:dTDP-4-dehydrorhamnose 3,5-epimerase [Stutzerimonas nitrititolerans]
MQITPQAIADVLLIEPQVHGDARGYFCESWRKDTLEIFLRHELIFCQDNESRSSRGVLRGLHFQLPPFAQTKLVRVLEGEVLDVAVDIRAGSPTFGQHVAVRLSGENKKQLFVPRGFAHGFVVLSETALFAYKVDSYYSPECDRGIAFDDPALGIDWLLPREQLQLSVKDQQQPLLAQLEQGFNYAVNYYA